MRHIEGLQEKMRSLYRSLDYFVSVEPEHGVSDYEEAYHGVTMDPDGNLRHLLEERTQSLEGIKEILSFLDQQKPGRLLDIGCGLGWLLSYLGEGWQKYGIEISKFASTHAKKYGSVHNGILEDFPAEKESFDVIVMNHVVEHLHQPLEALKRIQGLLKPTGKFVLGTPDFDSGAARRYGWKFRLLHDPTHISLFSYDSMQRCLRDLGFVIDYVEFPFFETHWFTKEALLKLLDHNAMSPPFYGSVMTFFCSLPGNK